MPMASIVMPSMSMPSVPVPATFCVPWHRTDREQHRQHDEYPHPLLRCSHGDHLLLRARTRMFPDSVPTISLAFPVQSHVSAYDMK
jgi:hypothetical protein